MSLSVIIVNYNVKYFLEQCLLSVLKSSRNIESEIIVVDNASADGSCQMVKQRFESVFLIENKKNYGFSYANNQAIKISIGEFILLLNPDTIVEEDTFEKCINFMNNHPDAGSMTVKMIDGKGQFLPESKRALPSPIVSFYKIIGLTKLFPRSKRFGRYHLGYLDNDQTHEIEILPGAFMFIRKSILDKIGLLDETFFMYGEDIDLSYRILKAGYKNYYYPQTKIIHYKGESTKKGSLNYVITFYKAMAIFAKKHFSQKNAKIYIGLIYVAILFRAIISATRRVILRILLPLADILFIAFGVYGIINFWEISHFHTATFYPEKLVIVMISIYTGIWVLSSWLFGSYDKPQKILSSLKGIVAGTLAILVIYALLPLEYRFSRIIILFGGIWAAIFSISIRLLINQFNKDIFPVLRRKKNIAIIGNTNEADRIINILTNSQVDYKFVGLVSPKSSFQDNNQIGTIDQIEEFIRVNKVNEVIFCGSDITSQQIINTMLKFSESGVEYKIAPENSLSIIGSNFVSAPENFFSPEFTTIGAQSSRRSKRIFDIYIAISIIILSPIWLVIKPKKVYFLYESFQVFAGLKTWVGYIPNQNTNLPIIRPSVFHITSSSINDLEEIQTTNLLYAKNYRVKFDFSFLIKNIIALLGE